LREEIQRRYPNRTRNRIIAVVLPLVLILIGGATYWAKRDDLFAARYSKGIELWQGGAYEKSVTTLRAIYNDYPSFPLAPDALFQSAEILNMNLHRYQEALLAYLLVLKNYPEHNLQERSLRQVANIYKYRMLDYSDAIVAYQKLLDLGAEGRDRLLYEVADAYFKLNNFEQARIEFETLSSEEPRSALVAEARYRTGVCLNLEGKYKEAETQLKSLIKEGPDTTFGIEARFALAETLEQMERLRESRRILEELQGLYPNQEALEQKLEQVNERISKKKRAI